VTLINTQLTSLLGLQSIAGASPVRSSASTRAENNIVEKSVAQQRISAINNRQFAIRDTSNAITFIQTTDNALVHTTSGLIELRLLAQQASNLTLTATQSSALVVETNAIKSKLNAIAVGTVVNGHNILDGTVDKVTFQIGPASNETISIPGFKADTQALGSLPGFRQSTGNRVRLSDQISGTQGIQEGRATTTDINHFTLLISDSDTAEGINIAQSTFGGAIKTVTDTSDLTNRGNKNFGSGLARSIAERINTLGFNTLRNNTLSNNTLLNKGQTSLSGVVATALTQFQSSEVASADFSGAVDTSKGTSVGIGKIRARDLLINGVDIGALLITAKDVSGGLVRAINDKSDISGVFASINTAGSLLLSAYDGRDIVISTASTEVTNTLFGAGENRFNSQFSDLRISGRVTLSSDKFQRFLGADILKTGLNSLDNFGASDNTISLVTIATTDFSNTVSAESALSIIDSALSQVASFRTELAATQKTILESIIDPLARIRSEKDAQILASQTNILVNRQGPIATVSQANISPQHTAQLLT
jgi:flagellin